MLAPGLVTTFALDMSTLFIVASLVSVLLGLFLLFLWQHDRIAALAWWGAAYLIGGFAVALWSAPEWGAPALPPGVPGTLLLLASGMVWTAARIFHGRPVRWLAMGAGAGVWLLGNGLPGLIPPGANRIALASLIAAGYAFLTAAELWRERRRSLRRRWPALLVPVLHAAVFLFPLPLAGLLPDEHAMAASAHGWTTVFALVTLLYAVGAAFIVLVLTKEHILRLHKTAALTDPLTGLFNRRGFDEAARQLMQTRARHAQPVSVLVFDLDHFKAINDRFGHAVGDEVLKLFASLARTKMRATDFVARLGGEEFAAVIPGRLEEGILVAERVRAAFETAARRVSGHPIGATVSVGVACHEASGAIDLEALLARADRALYAAKASGRNRVEAAPHAAAAESPAPAAVGADHRQPQRAGHAAGGSANGQAQAEEPALPAVV